MTSRLTLVFLLLLYPASTWAYIGPGIGGGAIAAALGIVGAVLLALFSVIYYPIKRAIKRRKKSKKS